MNRKVALVTGANKGIGFAAAQQLAEQGFHVLVGARDDARGEEAAARLRAGGASAEYLNIDVSEIASIEKAAEIVKEKFETLDVLVNNAAISLDDGRNLFDVPLADWRATYETNVFGPLFTARAFWPLLQKSESPRIVNVSSGAGSLQEMGGGMPSYGASKTALNAITKKLTAEGAGKISVNSICPGWVKTDMGGRNAPRTPQQGASIITRLATMDDPPSGKFLNESGELPW
jgi:NAD(P)-dependent dehydrogenase (short-subunit alcohol dehydrogenase family)